MYVGRLKKIFAVCAILGGLLSACGGGSSSSDSVPAASTPAKTLIWEAPMSYTNGTPLNPATDLQSFEIYVKENPSFGPTDSAEASVAPEDRSFNLVLLAPQLSPGVTYYVAIRAVTNDGAKSDFSPTASFSL